MQLFSADAKSWKKHPQMLLRIPQIHFFSLLPWLPKQKNSCSKMWPIDHLYIELGNQENNLKIVLDEQKTFLLP